MGKKNRVLLHLRIFLPLFFLTAVFCPESGFSADRTARVTHMDGAVFIGPAQDGPWQVLKTGMSVAENQFLKTGKNGRIELTMPDSSKIRLSGNTTFELNRLYFPAAESPKVKTKLYLGRLWVSIKKAVGKRRGNYDTHIATAVIGVRGTAYDLKSAEDKSADIYVYEGAVGVGPPIFVEGGSKKEVSWPSEVSEKKWEEIIVNQLQRLHIGADGKPGEPKPFDPEKEKDDWVIWNRKRDALEN